MRDQQFRRGAGWILTAAALWFGLTLPARAVEFSDVDPDSELGAAVSLLVQRGIIAGMGDGTFGAAQGLNRAQVCRVVNQTFGYTESCQDLFADVPAEHWAWDEILIARQAGYIAGVGDNRFEPEKELTVEQFSMILYQITGLGSTGEVSSGAQLTVADWAMEAVNACLDHGLWQLDETGGIRSHTGETIVDTSVPCSRGDMAIVLANYVQANQEEPEEDSPFVLLDYDWNNDLFSYDPSTTVLTYEDSGAQVYQGIDVSYHQTVTDWAQVKESGVDFVFVRCGGRGYGLSGNLFRDTQFENYIQGAYDAGLAVGVYFYATAVTGEEAEQEAAYVLEIIEPYRSLITLPVVYDWEIYNSTARNAKVDDAVVTDCVRRFHEAVSAAGFDTMVYFNRNIGKKLDFSLIGTERYWYARYPDLDLAPDIGDTLDLDPRWEYQLHIWQYTSTGVCPGIKGKVDRNIAILTDLTKLRDEVEEETAVQP